MKYYLEKGNEAKPFIKEALSNRLYVSGWYANPVMNEIVSGEGRYSEDNPKHKILEWYFAFARNDENEIVAWRMWFRLKYQRGYDLWRFTKKSYRNRGIQKKLQRKKPRKMKYKQIYKGRGTPG